MMYTKILGEQFNMPGMKTMFKSIIAFAFTAMAFASCVKEADAPVTESKTVQFLAESIETKTAFGTPDNGSYPTLWTENDEEIKLLLNLNEEVSADVNVSDDFKTASFNAEFTVKAEGGSTAPYTFYALSPADAYVGKNSERFTVTIPTSQTPLANSVDESAQILYAVSDEYNELPDKVSLHFGHFTAYGKFSFKNLDLDGANVTSVAITSSVNFAGRWNYVVADGSYAENSGSSTITLNTTDTENLWFACAPVDMDGQTLTFTVNTDKGPLSKTATLSNKKFNAGKIATMTVDMQGITFGEKETYELVTDAADLTPDSKIIIVASEYDVALSTTQNTSNRTAAAVTKGDDTISNPGNDVQIITLEDGNLFGTVAFNVGDGYLYAASSGSNHLKTQNDKTDNGSWVITIENGIATIKAQGANTRNWIRYNSSNNPPIFSCYGSGQNDVSIYKLPGTGIKNYLKVSDESVSVDSDATSASFKVASDLDWTATSSSATVTTSGNVVNVSFAANQTAEKKNYTVTVSAEGADPLTVTIIQAAQPTKATVAQFLSAAEDDTVYELTGTIASIAEAYNSQYNNISIILSDGANEVKIFRMSCDGIADPSKISVGDGITVQGLRRSYEGVAQMPAGSKCIEFIDNDAQDDGGGETPVPDGPGYFLVTNLADITTGEYVIAANVNGTYYAMSNGFASKINGAEFSVTNSMISLDDANGYVVTITKNGDNYTIYNGSKYLKYASSTNLGTQDSGYDWKIASGTNGTFRVTSTASTTRGIVYRAKSYHQFGGYAVSNAAASSEEYFDIELFKKNN